MTKIIKPYRNKGTCLETTPNDLQAICELTIDSLQRHNGRMVKYENSEEGRQRFLNDCIEYFKCLNEGNKDREPSEMLLPSVESLCVFLSISRVTLHNYSARSEGWLETINTIRTAIASAKMQLACRGKIPPIVAIFDFCNNYQYHNTSMFTIATEQPEATQTPQIAESELAQIAVGAEPELPQIPEDFSQE